MGESDSPNVPPLAQEPGSQSRQEPPVVGSAAGPPGGGLPPLQVAPPPQETETDKHAERPHRITILLALLALIISVASAILQYVNAVQARKEAAQAAEKQAADVERSRIAAENSAESGRVLAEATQFALKLQSRGTTAVEKSAEAAQSLARVEEVIREIVARSQSSRLIVRLEPYKDPKSGADSRRLLLVNGTSIPALGVEVGYEIHTLGMPDQTDLVWKLVPNEFQAASESVDFYVKAIEKLKPRYFIDFLAPETGVTVADTLPAPKWFSFTLATKATDLSSIPVPTKYTPLRSAVVFGYVKYADNANKSKKVPFCFPLDPKKMDLSCQKVNPIE